jgi:hypothetical protein
MLHCHVLLHLLMLLLLLLSLSLLLGLGLRLSLSLCGLLLLHALLLLKLVLHVWREIYAVDWEVSSRQISLHSSHLCRHAGVHASWEAHVHPTLLLKSHLLLPLTKEGLLLSLTWLLLLHQSGVHCLRFVSNLDMLKTQQLSWDTRRMLGISYG